MLTMPLMSEYADQCLPEGHLNKGCACGEDQTTTFALQSSLSITGLLRHTGCLVFAHPPLPSFLLCLSPFLHISTKADQISEQLKTPWTSKSLNQDLLFLFFPFQKTGQGSRHWLKLAYTGTCWPTLAREWYRLNGCQVIEDCQSNFKWPLSPSLLLFHTPLPSIYSPTAIVCFS